MLKWPDRAKIALRELFEPLQEIDVYVEDLNDEAFYRSLLKQATQDTVKIARVFSLGCRAAVVSTARNYNHASRPALFIVDGDLPWVKGDPPLNIIGLHQHDAYCVENLLFCEKAIITLFSQELAITEDITSKQLLYTNWTNSIREPLSELFAAFATLNTYNPQAPTVSKGVSNLCSQHNKKLTKLDTHKTNKARDSALQLAEAASTAEIAAQTYQKILKRIKSLPEPLHAVSGKDFLIPLLNFHLSSCNCRIKTRTLRIRLACAGDQTRFANLANALEHAARGY